MATNRKGASFERDILPWLQVLFPRIKRTGVGHEGSDYHETGPFCIEAKCRKDMRLADWMKQVVLAKSNEGRRWAVVVHKRRMFGPQGAYVTMTLEEWVDMIAHLKGIEVPEDLAPVSEYDFPDW